MRVPTFADNAMEKAATVKIDSVNLVVAKCDICENLICGKM